MRDLIVHDNDLIVATHGRSFWILDDLAPLRQLDPTALPAITLFTPSLATRVRDNLNTDTPLPPEEPTGENPPDGAIIDFYLRDAAAGPVVLEILDAKSQLVRRYSSADEPEVVVADFAKLPIPPYWPQWPATLPASAGLHRWVWDLHYAAPDALRRSYPIAAVKHRTPRLPLGARALPGVYQVKLTVGSQSFTAPLALRMDPRVKTAPADWQKNFALQTELASLLDRGTKAQRRARSVLEQIDARAKPANAPAADLAALKNKIDALLTVRPPAGSGEPAPTLAEPTTEAADLYSKLDRADAAPTKAQAAAAKQLAEELKEALEAWDKLVAKDVSALNEKLKSLGLPELKTNSASTKTETTDGDDDDLG